MAQYDLAIIGGGINGAGIARDAAGRGLKVLLIEQGDLASGTSSASTKLIHGGLRYLEHREFRLVREALSEREVLLRNAPHLVRPLRFVLPPQAGNRPAWMIRAGLFLYDHLGRRKILPRTQTLDLSRHVSGGPLRRRFTFAYEFSDCTVDDSRLVVLNAMDAAARGADVRTRTRCVRAERGEEWTLVLNVRGRRAVVTARALVNAAGAWVAAVADTVLRSVQVPAMRLVKGSHIVVKSLFDHGLGYVLPTADGRFVFALPFGAEFTLIGTTEREFIGDPAILAPGMDEIDYLCDTSNSYFRENITAGDVVWAYSGVRPLIDDHATKPTDATRDYLLTVEEDHGQAPLLTVHGGKITTYRCLAEAALGRLSHFFALQPQWTGMTPLPGGDFAYDSLDLLVTEMQRRWPFLADEHAKRLGHAYGTRVKLILDKAKSLSDLGVCFGSDLTAAEVRYLMHYEWAETADDVLWRRSKLGLRMSKDEQESVARFMATEIGTPRPRNGSGEQHA